MATNILFLDFDGPLYPDRVIRFHPANRNQSHPSMDRMKEVMIENGDTFAASSLTYWKMDDVAVEMLNMLMEYQPFLTVVSSTWGEMCSKNTVEHIFEVNNLKLNLHPDWLTIKGTVTSMYGWSGQNEDRLLQVKRWIDDHKDEIGAYAVLDDPGSGGNLASEPHVEAIGLNPNNVVIVDYMVGMEQGHYFDLQKILGK